ncbi:hypothetical protein MVEN_00457200 [Mycena venus]|uniref:Uncharacterized protein n=1 Tax=Mycena venus TaxID=2733690 RepID=A0A8H7DBR2_9AGAR|nr:hypothetical protein MVEN_00457200 [Mycena venus]
MFPVFLLVLYTLASASQIPFQNPGSATSTVESGWNNLASAKDANFTGHLIFDTTNSLLHRWPNTRYRNGTSLPFRTIVIHFLNICRPHDRLWLHSHRHTAIPRPRRQLPPPTVPEWTATDPEHAFNFCRDSSIVNNSISGCWQLTLVTTRPLSVLYFDGSSAAKMGDGPLDAQDLLIFGKIDPGRARDARARINGLCAWGREFGIDGYVRMQVNFEVMLCGFSNGVELLSADYLAAWLKGIKPPALSGAMQASFPGRPNTYPSFQALELRRFETILSGSWHNRYPGETRIHLDLTRLISFYDTSLAPSLIAQREGKERWDHRLLGISAADMAAVNSRLRAMLVSDIDIGSGVDWKTLFHVVVDRYADRLETLAYLLNTTTPANLRQRTRTIQTHLRVILTPYLHYSARPHSIGGSNGTDHAWALPVWHACTTTHTAHIHRNPTLHSQLTDSERVLLDALDGTNKEICRVVVRMWTAGVYGGLDAFISGNENRLTSTLVRILGEWRTDAHALMAWLDWSVWVKCRPMCSPEEMCYLPTYPYFGILDPARRDDERWKRPQPRCIRRFEPYSEL